MDQALNSQKTPHTSPLRASYGMSFVSILMKNDRVIKGFYCIYCEHNNTTVNCYKNRLDCNNDRMTNCDKLYKLIMQTFFHQTMESLHFNQDGLQGRRWLCDWLYLRC